MPKLSPLEEAVHRRLERGKASPAAAEGQARAPAKKKAPAAKKKPRPAPTPAAKAAPEPKQQLATVEDKRPPNQRHTGKPRDGSKNPGGRPVVWTEEAKKQAFETICLLLAGGAKSVASVCAEHPDELPSKKEFFIWLSQNPKFGDQYARAKASQIESLLDDIPHIADNELPPELQALRETMHEMARPEGNDSIATKFGEIPNKEWIMRSKLRVDARVRLAELLAPKKYGKKVDLNHGGQVGVVTRYHKPERKKA